MLSLKLLNFVRFWVGTRLKSETILLREPGIALPVSTSLVSMQHRIYPTPPLSRLVDSPPAAVRQIIDWLHGTSMVNTQ